MSCKIFQVYLYRDTNKENEKFKFNLQIFKFIKKIKKSLHKNILITLKILYIKNLFRKYIKLKLSYTSMHNKIIIKIY